MVQVLASPRTKKVYPGWSRAGLPTRRGCTRTIMVIGMKYGRTKVRDLAAKEKTCAIAKAFITEFLQQIHGPDRF